MYLYIPLVMKTEDAAVVVVVVVVDEVGQEEIVSVKADLVSVVWGVEGVN